MRHPASSLSGVLLWFGLTACSVQIADQTPSVLTRNSTGVYDVTAEVVPSGSSVDVLSVTAVVDGSPFPLSAGADDQWAGPVGITPCKNGFSLVFEAEWDAPFSGGTEVEPPSGALQKWIDGSAPDSCPAIFGRTFTVSSQEDLPDAAPGDGVCAAVDESCTLRAAVMEANASSGVDRIQVQGGTYTLTRAGSDDTALNGDLDILESVTIERTDGFVTVDASEIDDRLFDVFAGGEEGVVTLRGMLLQNGHPSGRGGGIFNRTVLFLERMRVENNEAGTDQAGGGIYTESPLFASEVRIRENTSGHFGGGLFVAASGSAVLIRSEVTSNVNQIQHGGGIAVSGGSLEATNVTISGNTTTVHGGGIWANGGSQVTLRNVTVARNRSDSDNSGGGDGGGIIFAHSDRPYRLGNTIVAENFKGTGSSASDCQGTIYSLGNNLIEDVSACSLEGLSSEDLTGLGRADLNPLGFSGGSTRVHTLAPTSEARDAGNGATPNDASLFACREEDQRGQPRPADGGGGPEAVCDIGAVEMQ